MPTQEQLPKILYVYSDDDDDLRVDERSWYCVLSEEDLSSESIQGLVGVYELKKVGEVKTTVKFTEHPQKKAK